MVRFILAVLALSVTASSVQAERIFINTPEQAADFAATIQPGETYDIEFNIRMQFFEGSFEDNTATVHAARSWFPSDEPAPPEVFYSMHLPNTSNWHIHLRWLLGVHRHESGDIPFEVDEHGNGTTNDIDLPELNSVRNQFGQTGPLPGDVTWNNVVDIEDLNTVRNMFGAPDLYSWDGETFRTTHTPDSLELPTSTVIPEPATLTMLALGLFGLSTLRARVRCRDRFHRRFL